MIKQCHLEEKDTTIPWKREADLKILSAETQGSWVVALLPMAHTKGTAVTHCVPSVTRMSQLPFLIARIQLTTTETTRD